MSKTFNTRVKWKRDTSANWTANNPILLDGEIIIIDTNAGETRFKIGNGISTYTQLPFQDEYIQNSITNINSNLASHEQNYNNPHQVNKEDIGLGNVDNVKQYSISNPPPYPVTSVNSKTGAVQLNATDVGALPNTTIIPSKTSQLNNDSGFISKIPIATSTKVGGVKPVAKTSAMTQNVGISSDGLLYTNPSNIFLVTLTTPYYTGGHHSSNDITADKRFAEISAAYQNGETVQAMWGGWILDLVTITNDYADFAMCTGLYNVNTALSTITAVCETNNGVDTWNIGSYQNDFPEASTTAPKAPGIAAVGTTFEYARADHVHPRELPSVKSSDNGKFLRVVDSAWVAASVPDANGGIF